MQSESVVNVPQKAGSLSLVIMYKRKEQARLLHEIARLAVRNTIFSFMSSTYMR